MNSKLKNHKIAFKAITEELRNDWVLKCYDLARTFFLECDASVVGTGFTFLQNFVVDIQNDTNESLLTTEYLMELLPIAYGSQTFTECERRYASIERESFWPWCVA